MRHLRFLFLLSLSACSSVPDVIVCRPRTVNSGFCTYTVSNKDQIVDDTHKLNNMTWLDLKIDSIYLPAESWAKIKEYIINECKRNGNCQQDLSSWTRKIDSLN